MSDMSDYKSYTLEELIEVRGAIDKDHYPERYSMVLEEIRKREPEEVSFEKNAQEQEPPSKKKRVKWIVISLFWVVVWVFYGEVSGKNNASITREGDPLMFWLLIAFGIGNVLYNIYEIMYGYEESE